MLATVKVWEAGFNPARGIVKFNPGSSWKITLFLSLTTSTTGIDTFPVDDPNTISPRYEPVTKPTLDAVTVMILGVVPLVALALSQLFVEVVPLKVVLARVQLMGEAPVLFTGIGRGAGAKPPDEQRAIFGTVN